MILNQIENRMDKGLLITTFILMSFGLVMVLSSSYIYSFDVYKDGHVFFKKHALSALLGIIALIFFYNFKYQYFKKVIYLLLILNLALLGITLVPGIGFSAGGATRWINLGIMKFQPSEVTKLVMIIYFAYIINLKRDKLKYFSTGFLPCVLVTSVFILFLLKQPDFGTAFIISFMMLVMLFIGGSRKSYIFSTIIMALPLLYYAIMNTSYRKRRIFAFLDPWADPQNSGFQIIQSLVAFFSGGIFGRGLGDSQQKLFYLPEAHTDFIFAVVAEELGFIGIVCLLLVFLYFIYRGFSIAFKSEDPFATLLAFGITTILGLQITLNIGVVLGVFPTKGIVLPFISYGGTSLVVTMAMVGILLNISSQNKTAK